MSGVANLVLMFGEESWRVGGKVSGGVITKQACWRWPNPMGGKVCGVQYSPGVGVV